MLSAINVYLSQTTILKKNINKTELISSGTKRL